MDTNHDILAQLRHLQSSDELISDTELLSIVQTNTQNSVAVEPNSPHANARSWRRFLAPFVLCLCLGLIGYKVVTTPEQSSSAVQQDYQQSSSNVSAVNDGQNDHQNNKSSTAPELSQATHAPNHATAAVLRQRSSQPISTGNLSNTEVSLPTVAERVKPPHSIASVEVLALDSAELSELGVKVSGDSLEVMSEELYDKTKDTHGRPLGSQERLDLNRMLGRAARAGYDTTETSMLIRERVVLDARGLRSKRLIPYTGWTVDQVRDDLAVGHSSAQSEYQPGHDSATAWHYYSFIYAVNDRSPLLPRCVRSTQDLSAQLSSAVLAELKLSGIWENYFLSSTSLPVQIQLSNEDEVRSYCQRSHRAFDSSALRKSTVRLWYCLTPSFIARLPKRYRDPLQKEFGLFQKVIAGELSSDDACVDLQGKSRYVELCQMSAGRVKHLGAFPNPAHDYVTASFELSEASVVGLYLYDASSGIMLRQLQEPKSYPKGVINERIDFGSSIRSGVYMIVLVTDKGEQAMIRVIVT